MRWAPATPSKVRWIEGIVESAGGALGEDGWSLVVILQPWREVGGPVRRKFIRVELDISNKTVIDAAHYTWEGHAMRLQIEKLADAERGSLEWNVGRSEPEWIQPPPELMMRRWSETKLPPVKSAMLRRLRIDPDTGDVTGTRRVGLRKYTVAVDVSDPTDATVLTAELARAESAVRGVENDLARLRDAAAVELLDVYNRNWRESGRPLSELKFKKKLKLRELDVSETRITAFMSSGALFGDHGVELRLTPSLDVEEVCLC